MYCNYMDDIDNNIMSVSDLKLKRDTFISVCSARKTGKSYLLAELIYYFLTDQDNKCDYLYVFSNTAGLHSGTNEQFNFIDQKAMIPASEKIMEKVIHGLMYSQKKSNFRYKILIVLDDIVVSHKYPIIELLATMGRHYGLTVILSAQISNQVVSPTIRNNISYLFWRRLTRSALKDNIFPIVGTALEDYHELQDLTESNIHDFQFLFFNNNEDLNSESMQIVKANEVPKGFKYKVTFEEKNQTRQRQKKYTQTSRNSFLNGGFKF